MGNNFATASVWKKDESWRNLRIMNPLTLLYKDSSSFYDDKSSNRRIFRLFSLVLKTSKIAKERMTENLKISHLFRANIEVQIDNEEGSSIESDQRTRRKMVYKRLKGGEIQRRFEALTRVSLAS